MESVKSVRYVSAYNLEIVFSNGFSAVVNLEQELYGPLFSKLKGIDLFRLAAANPDTHTIEWPNGTDLAPEYLYSLAKKTSRALVTN
ncbi:MAG TPA: DUF2442 domain-containing protein [Candidatus Kapabacteria bacterium]|jgi:hypothetical protein